MGGGKEHRGLSIGRRDAQPLGSGQGGKRKTEMASFQGERKNLRRLGLRKAGNEGPEFRECWQLGLMMMPRVLMEW